MTLIRIVWLNILIQILEMIGTEDGVDPKKSDDITVPQKEFNDFSDDLNH